jgi:hypothetical protein
VHELLGHEALRVVVEVPVTSKYAKAATTAAVPTIPIERTASRALRLIIGNLVLSQRLKV